MAVSPIYANRIKEMQAYCEEDDDSLYKQVQALEEKIQAQNVMLDTALENMASLEKRFGEFISNIIEVKNFNNEVLHKAISKEYGGNSNE